MKLLILTQKVDENDSNLSFFCRWIEEFGKRSEFVTVICLEKGRYFFRENVKVLSLGKESIPVRFPSILKRIIFTFRLLRLVFLNRNNFDSVFIHMNPEYAILAGPLFRLFRKKIGFWYTHQSKHLLNAAVRFVDLVFSPSKDSFPVLTPKLRVVGHGVDTEIFLPAEKKNPHMPLRILSDSRITKSKNVEMNLRISELLLKRGFAHVFWIIGAPLNKRDEEYHSRLKLEAKQKKLPIEFKGGIPFKDVARFYREADIFVNHANVGALNKTGLQAMAVNLYMISSNVSYNGIFPLNQIVAPDAEAFASKIEEFANSPFASDYRNVIINEHSIGALVPKIISNYEK